MDHREVRRGPSRRGDRRKYTELRGLQSFQRWLADSGRIVDGAGSPWWQQVNGLLVLDVIESRAGRDGPDNRPDRAEDELADRWRTYWSARGRAARRRACWDAHQASLGAAARASGDLLASEPASEQDFIALALQSVELAAAAQLPTGAFGSVIISGFCDVFYPSAYPAAAGAGVAGHGAIGAAKNGRRLALDVGARAVHARVARRRAKGRSSLVPPEI